MLLSGIQQFTILDYPGKVAAIAFTPGCNMRCGFCHNPEFVLPKHIQQLKDSFIPEENFLSFLDQRKGLLDGVVVSGGEPTLMHDLSKFIHKIKQRGFLVKLDTNGSNPETVGGLIDAGLIDYLEVDAKTSLEEYPHLAGKFVKPERVDQTIHMVKKGIIAYELRTTLIQEHHTPEVLEAMKPLVSGATKLYLQSFRPGNTLDPDFAHKHPFSLEEMEGIREMFEDVVESVVIR